jgi:hypothetical protein
LLLRVAGPTSFEALRTVDGTTYATFREAAIVRGLFTSDLILERTIIEAFNTQMTILARIRYFALILVHCEISDPNGLLNGFVDEICPQVPLQPGQQARFQDSKEARRFYILKRLEYYLREQGKSCMYF